MILSARWAVLCSLAAGLPLAACSGGGTSSHPHAGGSGGTQAGGTGGTHTGGSGGTQTGGTGGTQTGGSGGTQTGGTGGLAGGGSGGTGAGGTGGVGGIGGTGNTGGSTGTCGDGNIQPGEGCDSTNFNGQTCASYGFLNGSLACTALCVVDSAGCSGSENCVDGVDNDGNGTIDCADSSCTAKCASACAGPPPLPDPSTVTGTSVGHGDSLFASCTGGVSGPDVAYEFTAAHTGVFEAIMNTSDSLALSARTTCATAGSELDCTAGYHIKFPITQGTKLYVVVDGLSSSSAGPYQISAESRVIACGDAHRDGTEGCDDGNTTSGDGCSATCALEPNETEPNNTSAQASAFASPFFGSINPDGDVDFVEVNVTQAGTTLSASVGDLGDAACTLLDLDSYLELRASDGTTVLASDNDSGEGYCSVLSQSGLAAGKYYLVVSAAPGAYPTTFPYRLSITLS